MQDEDKIFALVVQAEDIQRYAVDLLGKLPEASRSALEGAAKETLMPGCERLEKAVREVLGAATALRRWCWLVGVFLPVVACALLGTGTYFSCELLVKNRAEELEELKNAIKAEKGVLAELESKTWRLELVNFEDGTKGIILPKGMKYEHHGDIKGKTCIVIR